MTGGTGAADDDVVLAEQLLAEWDEGRGASKSEIERRVWGDGGAHGRRFDRFIRQKLGVATSKPSNQPRRVRGGESKRGARLRRARSYRDLWHGLPLPLGCRSSLAGSSFDDMPADKDHEPRQHQDQGE